jgi:redox-sensitive bicupin YhaK (pirin superfamily)
MREPRYQNIPPENVPMVKRDDGIIIKVIAGEVDGVKGAVTGIVTDPLYVDITLPANTNFAEPVPNNHNAFAYVLEGTVAFGDSVVTKSKLVTFDSGEKVTAATGDDVGRFLLIAGKPLNEPMARHGPFVMNTKEEIRQAIVDYQSGKF